MEQVENVYKVTLGTGKVVLLREMKVRYEDLAIQAAGGKSGKNEMLAQKRVGDEILRLLIVEVDGEKPSKDALEQLDKLFSYKELGQLRKVVGQIAGDSEGELEEPKVEMKLN